MKHHIVDTLLHCLKLRTLWHCKLFMFVCC